MAKISKPTLTVSKEDSGANQLKYPAEKIIDYPSSVKPIDADKFICTDDEDTLSTIESLYTKLEANRDYTVLQATESFSFIGGVEKATKHRVSGSLFLYESDQKSADRPSEEYGGNGIVIPKHPSVVPVLDDNGRMLYVAFVRCKQNLKAGCEVFVTVGEPSISAEFIEFPVSKEFTLASDPWTEGKHMDLFIDVEILCEVLP